MSDETPRRGYGLGDEPDIDAARGLDGGEDGAEDTSVLRRSLLENKNWFRPAAGPAPVPARAKEARSEWADVPFGQEPKPRRAGSPATVTDGGGAPTDPGSGSSRADDEGKRKKLRTSLLLTVASAILPGSGLLGAPERWQKITGAVTAVGAIALVGYFANWALNDTASFATIAVDPDFLGRAALSLIMLGLIWVALIATTHIVTRPGGLVHGRRVLGAALVTALAFGVAAPSALGARYSRDQILLLEKVFGPEDPGDGGSDGVKSTTRPTLATESTENPWKDIPRVNVLLLGADGNEARADEIEKYSVRTDTIMVASIDTVTGDTLLVQIPRNVQYTPFPEGSEMAEAFPRGFRGEPEADWLINSIWAKTELDYPNLMEGNTFRGAEALKLGVEGVTGLHMDYFMMLDIDGLQRLITAMGGVEVNINEPLPMGTARNCRDPERCLQPGPDQRLNGYEAMWYARSRATTSDYSRMARQSCLIDAVIKQANPATMLTSYEGIANAASHMVTTDIPQPDLKAFVQLAFKVKDAKVQRLVYSPGKNGYSYENPDFDEMREAVENVLNPPDPEPTTAAPSPVQPTAAPTTVEPTADPTTASPSPSATPELQEGAQTVADACAWHGYPEGEEEG